MQSRNRAPADPAKYTRTRPQLRRLRDHTAPRERARQSPSASDVSRAAARRTNRNMPCGRTLQGVVQAGSPDYLTMRSPKTQGALNDARLLHSACNRVLHELYYPSTPHESASFFV